MNENIKKCPCCGSENVELKVSIDSDRNHLYRYVQCCDCNIKLDENFNHKKAIEEWNNLPRKSDNLEHKCEELEEQIAGHRKAYKGIEAMKTKEGYLHNCVINLLADKCRELSQRAGGPDIPNIVTFAKNKVNMINWNPEVGEVVEDEFGSFYIYSGWKDRGDGAMHVVYLDEDNNFSEFFYPADQLTRAIPNENINGGETMTTVGKLFVDPFIDKGRGGFFLCPKCRFSAHKSTIRPYECPLCEPDEKDN